MSRRNDKSKSFVVAKALANEEKNPYIIELPVPATGLDTTLNRQIMTFHKSRHIQPRFGRTIFRDGETYYRWCFSDLLTARTFLEQFGGEFCSREPHR
jgi:hypothetical protein